MSKQVVLSVLVLLNFVSVGKFVPVSRRGQKNGGPDDFVSQSGGDHILQRRSFGPIELHNGLGTILGDNEMIQVNSAFLPRSHPFHSYLPYPTNNHGPFPGPFTPQFGQTHQHFPGYTQNDGHGYHGNYACGGYPCHHGGNNQYPGYGHHNHGNDEDNENCNRPDHNHMGPHHHHHHQGEGVEPVTTMPTIHTDSTPKVIVPTPGTKGSTSAQTKVTKSTTTTQTPIYDIDIRFGNATG